MSNRTWRRPSGRQPDALRPVTLATGFTKHAAGSVLATFGDTRVLCTASFEKGVPRFLRGTGQGWLTCEYGMLPGSTHIRTNREAARGRQGGRTMEIQRLIGRSLRTAVDLEQLGERTIRIDCDVIQADGGTRTVSITGGCVALVQCLERIAPQAFRRLVASVSVGVYQGAPVLDLDYAEDSRADTDMNIVMIEDGGFIEVQGTAEKEPFSGGDLAEMLALAESGIERLFGEQKRALGI